MKVVVALGGNALLRRGEPLSAEVQRANIARAAGTIATLAQAHELVLTHGNGPQVGLLALQSETCLDVPPYPLDVLDAESEGMIGYLLAQALQNRLPGRQITALLTRVEVSRDDPAFLAPTKPIGPFYDADEAQALARSRGWRMAQEGAKWRRIVASPEPRRILELPAIRLLVDGGVLVICSGGGGIPVAQASPGVMEGVEAVIDKDLAAALLAGELHADALLLLTDVDAVYSGWGTRAARPIDIIEPAQLRRMAFAAGSMAPKVEAACRFVESGGHIAAIGRTEDAPALLNGRAGTIVRAPGPRPGKR